MRVRVAFALTTIAATFFACSEAPSSAGAPELSGSTGANASSTTNVEKTNGSGGAAATTRKTSSAQGKDTAPATGASGSSPGTTSNSAKGGGSSAGGKSSQSAGSASGSSATTGTSSAAECTDIQTADHQGEPCSIWVDWGHCNADWLQGFCNKTCGRCTGASNVGAGGSSGSTKAGTGSGASVGSTSTSLSGGPTVARLGSDAQTGYATRYWDCCKPHCAWPGNASSPMRMCTEQNQSLSDSGAASSCDGGPAYTCWDMAPWAVSDTLAYGFAATPGGGSDCGKCYQLDFTGESKDNAADDGAKAIAQKSMIVQATNKGYDVAGGQFDLLIPGGGVGAFNGCSKQWGVDNSQLGAQYGGFALSCNYDKECTRKKCESVFGASNMEPLKKGCLFYVDWLETADNPRVRYKQVTCPAALSAKSGISG